MKQTDLAWAAGFFDGEGTLGFYTKHNGPKKNYHYGVVYAKVSQKDRRPLDRLASILGGKVYGPYNNGPKEKGWAIYYWHVQNATKVIEIFEQLKPYLSEPKIEQGLASINMYHQQIRGKSDNIVVTTWQVPMIQPDIDVANPATWHEEVSDG